MGVYTYFSQFPERLFFGAPPGDYYTWSIKVTNYAELKNYAHLTFVAHLFRYGAVITLLIYGGFAYLLVRYFSPRDPLFLCLAGIVSSSFFGANLLSDPTAWLLIGLLINKNAVEKLTDNPANQLECPQ